MRKLGRLLVQALGALGILLLYAARPFKRIMLGRLGHERIGYLSINTHLFLRERQLGLLPRGASYIFFCGRPANRQLLTMIQREITVIESEVLAKVFDVCRALLKLTPFYVGLESYKGNEFELFEGAEPTLKFSPAEEERGRAALASMGIGPGDWFVCLHNRDSAFLSKSLPGQDWAYHDYRDCEIENFLPAAEYISEQGGYVLRMGQVTQRPLASKNPRIIDYANTRRDDFLDIYLLAKCRFLIGADAGLAQVSTTFDRPVVNTNVPFIDWAAFRPSDIFIQKKLFSELEGRLLTYPEILARGYQRFSRSDWLKERRLRLIENSAEEILEATREMHERLAGTLRYSAEDDALQARYRGLFGPPHRFHGFRSRLGRAFLRRNLELILPQGAAAQ